MQMTETKFKIAEAELKFNEQFEKTFLQKSSASEVESSFLKSD